MPSFRYNDSEFVFESEKSGWCVLRRLPEGRTACVAAGLFAGMAADAAQPRLEALVRAVDPCGVRLVGPDVDHPGRVGDLRIVGPNVAHPNFIRWTTDSTSLGGRGD